MALLEAQKVRNLPAVLEAQVPSPGWEGLLEQGSATHSHILAWRIPWTEDPGRLQSKESQRVTKSRTRLSDQHGHLTGSLFLFAAAAAEPLHLCLTLLINENWESQGAPPLFLKSITKKSISSLQNVRGSDQITNTFHLCGFRSNLRQRPLALRLIEVKRSIYCEFCPIVLHF